MKINMLNGERRNKKMDEKDKKLAFIATLLMKKLTDQYISDCELQALQNIIDEFPDVDAKEFRY